MSKLKSHRNKGKRKIKIEVTKRWNKKIKLELKSYKDKKKRI